MSSFAVIYPYARSLLGDIGQTAMYSNAQLDAAIRLGLLEDGTLANGQIYSEAVASGNITPDLANNVDTLRIAVRTALALVRPSIGVKSYRTPVMQVQRNQVEVIAQLVNMLLVCTGEEMLADGTTDLDTWINGQLDFIAKMAGNL